MRRETGQAAVMTLLFLTVLLGMAAAVLDVGSWYRGQRQAQSTADAAALAAAQDLPQDTRAAQKSAIDYAKKNDGGVLASDVTFASDWGPDDTVRVKVNRVEPSFFAKLFGIDSVTVHAKASARSAGPAEAKWAAPIVVRNTHPELAGPGCPCFDVPTTITLGPTGAPGAFSLLNLDKDKQNGTIGTSTLAGWIQRGFDQYLPLGGYYSDPGAKFNSSQIQDALRLRFGTELLFPVYDTLTGQGSGATYHIIGWAAFHLDGIDARGNNGALAGYFTRVIWDGIQNSKGSSGPDFGVHTIALTD